MCNLQPNCKPKTKHCKLNPFGELAMKPFVSAIALLTVFCFSTIAIAQEQEMPKPGPELDVLKSEVGTWDVVIKVWEGPGEPTVTKGTEKGRMMGFWLVSEFKGNMMGLDFSGLGTYTFDSEKKEYVGRWIDSLSPQKMDMTGKYDKDAKSMTYTGSSMGPDGSPMKSVMKTTYNDDGTKTMTMHMGEGDQAMKVFEMNYTKSTRAKK
jgi:hypothetical protein